MTADKHAATRARDMVKVYGDTFEWHFARPPETIWSALANA